MSARQRYGAKEAPGATAANGGGGDPVYGQILDSMICGVMLLNAEGKIQTFNPAAAQILGLSRDRVLGESFAEEFIGDEGLDEFNEAILAAVYDGNVGHQRVVTIRRQDTTIPVSIAASYLRDDEVGEHRRLGVVAMFTDISEVERLKAKEIDLARSLKRKHEELRNAYRSLEDRNHELGAAFRKVRAVRIVAALAVVLVAIGVGAFLWQASPSRWLSPGIAQSELEEASEEVVTVRPQAVSATLSVASVLQPLREIPVTSPIEGKVGSVYVQHGQTVEAGQTLLELDVTDVQAQFRDARVAMLKARRRSDEIRNWTHSTEASQARRNVTRAQFALEEVESELGQMQFLTGKGLVPEARLRRVERAKRSRTLDLEAAEQDLKAVMERGREEREVAEIELKNATEELVRLEHMLASARVVAPVAGVVLVRGGGSTQVAGVGTSVEAGQDLLRVGDMSGVTAIARIDEVDVRRIGKGDAVRITGPAFPGVEIAARIVHVSSQASQAGRGVPSFEVKAQAENLGDEALDALRLGMSADLEIVVYEREDALMVPLEAVRFVGGGQRIRVRDPQGGQDRMVEVETGVTTLQSVEIRKGLKSGDQVVVP